MLKRVTLRDPATEIYTTLLHVFDHLSFGVEFHHVVLVYYLLLNVQLSELNRLASVFN